MTTLQPIRSVPPHVLAFVKAARPGLVKTRLAREIGDTEAARLYREWAAAAVQAVPLDCVVEVHYAPRQARQEMQAWLGSRPVYRAQTCGDVGQRLRSAVTGAFDRGASQVMAIGGDCPALTRSDFVQALAALREVDVVLGPALDGGYYLIGMRRCSPQLFRELPWSTLHVLPATLQRIRESGLTLRLLPAKDDIDDLAALERYRASSA